MPNAISINEKSAQHCHPLQDKYGQYLHITTWQFEWLGTSLGTSKDIFKVASDHQGIHSDDRSVSVLR